MVEPSPSPHLRTAKQKVLGGVALGIVAFGLWILVFFQVLFAFFDSVTWFPAPVMIAIDVLAVVATVLALWLLISGTRALVTMQEATEIEGLASVVGTLPQETAATDPQPVIDALLRLNDLDLPYSVHAERDGSNAIVTVQWRVEELRWRTLITRGSQVKRWRMVVRLQGGSGRYTFTEYTSWSKVVGSAATASVSGAKNWSRGRSMGAGSVSRVWAVGQVESPEGIGPSGSIRIVPSDAKVPVFRIIRAYGWRPKRDTTMARMWEY